MLWVELSVVWFVKYDIYLHWVKSVRQSFGVKVCIALELNPERLNHALDERES